MNFHSSPLVPLLEALDTMNDVLGRARSEYLALEAERKHIEANLIARQKGVSHARMVTLAQATPEWVEFSLKLARAQAVFEFQKLKFSIMEKNWQSAYLELKLNESLIRKQT